MIGISRVQPPSVFAMEDVLFHIAGQASCAFPYVSL